LPSVAETFEGIEQRSRPTRQWEPDRAHAKKGMLPARVRAMLRDDQEADSPTKAEAKSSAPLPQISDLVQAKEDSEVEAKGDLDPSPLAASERGVAPVARISKVGSGQSLARKTSRKLTGAERPPTVVSFINHYLQALPESKGDSPRDETLSVFFRGERVSASMSNHRISAGEVLHHAVGGRLSDENSADHEQLALHGVSVLIADRRRLQLGDSYREAFDDWSSYCSQASERPFHRLVTFSLDRPLGLQLEYDSIQHVTFVHKVLEEGQASSLGVLRREVVGKVNGRRVNTLEQFEDQIVVAQQLGKQDLKVLFIIQDDSDQSSTQSLHTESEYGEGGAAGEAGEVSELQWRFATGAGIEGMTDADEELRRDEEEEAEGAFGLVAGRRQPTRSAGDQGEGKKDELAPVSSPFSKKPRVPDEPIPVLPVGMGTSLEDSLPVTLYFVNQTTHMTMEVCWVDYYGRLVPRKLLQPGEVHLESSWSTHPWMLTAVEPPPFDPEYHDTVEEADRHAAEPQDTDMTVLVRVGDIAARDELRRYSLLWQPRERTMSVMPAARGGATTELREDLRPENARNSRTRIRNARAALVHNLRALRADPSGGANKGDSPVLTVFMMGQRHGESVIGQLMKSKAAAGPV